MKKLLIIVLGLIAIYEGQSLVPKYYAEQKGNMVKIYDSHQIVVPRYIIRQSGDTYKLFDTKQQIIPKYHGSDRDKLWQGMVR